MTKFKLSVCSFLILLTITGSIWAEEALISTVFFETDIRDAVTELVFQTGVNIIMDETVRGIVTLDLEQVPLEKVLTMLSLAGGFSFKQIDDYYFLGIIDPRSPSFRHLATTETIKLQYISQEEARNLLPPLYDSYIRSSPERDYITITATTDLIEKFRQDIAKIDQGSPQVLIQAIITEVSTAALQEFGVNLLDFSRTEGNSDWRGVRLSSESGSLLDTLLFQSRFLDYGYLLAQLRLLEEENNAEIKANPRVLVSDRQTVNLFSGQTQHLVIEGSGSSTSLQTIDVGITLSVTPKIINDNELEIFIAPEISHFVGDGYNKGGFTVRRNEVSTSIYVQNGQTLMIAGLTLDQETQRHSQVPILGSIPILRWLFSNKAEQVEERELFVFLVAEIQ